MAVMPAVAVAWSMQDHELIAIVLRPLGLRAVVRELRALRCGVRRVPHLPAFSKKGGARSRPSAFKSLRQSNTLFVQVLAMQKSWTRGLTSNTFA